MSKLSECKVEGVGTIRLRDTVKVKGTRGTAVVTDIYDTDTEGLYLGVYGDHGFRTAGPARIEWATSSKKVR